MARGTRGDILHQEVLQREIKRSACACSFLMCNSRRNGATLLVCVVVLCCFRSCAAERQEARFGRQMAAQNTDDPGSNTATLSVDQEIEQPSISGQNSNFESTIAGQLHKVLVKEFNENETVKGVASDGAGRSFDSTVRNGGGTLETVARVTRAHDFDTQSIDVDFQQENSLGGASPIVRAGSENEQQSYSQDSFIHQLRDVSRGIDKVMRTGKGDAEDVERLVDSSDNEFVISNPKSGTMELQQDLRLIQDLVILFCSAALGSTLFCLLGQPVITGYLLAGSLIGPGGLGLIVELVQVETLAQFGVIFLLFGLGLEFSASKLRHIRGVAVWGGCTQISLTMLLCGVASDVTGAGTKEGAVSYTHLTLPTKA